MSDIADRLRNFAIASRFDLAEIADEVEALEVEVQALRRPRREATDEEWAAYADEVSREL